MSIAVHHQRGAHGWGRSIGALLLPVEAVVSGEPALTLAGDDEQVPASIGSGPARLLHL